MTQPTSDVSGQIQKQSNNGATLRKGSGGKKNFKKPIISKQGKRPRHVAPQSHKPPPKAKQKKLGPVKSKAGRKEPILANKGRKFLSDSAKQPVATALPEPLKTNMEQMGKVKLDDVKVIKDTPQPTQMGMKAQAYNNQIHLASGQEQYLPHEAWHIVQQ